ncbi:hypothetical protein PFISCL1PPCAC_23779, partial [Pristionchus fissidentatus]
AANRAAAAAVRADSTNTATVDVTATLHAGNIHADVTESMLMAKFKSVGPVKSTRICRNAASAHAVGYAYINYQHRADAAIALNTLNSMSLCGVPLRLSWSRNSSTAPRQSTPNPIVSANVYIKNLDKSIDNKRLHDAFSPFGVITSHMVAVNGSGVSMGYGYVNFATESAARQAIQTCNGMFLAGKTVTVEKFKSR